MSRQSDLNPPRQLVFGPFLFDEASGELRKRGIRIRIEGQPLQILEILINQSGELVARDELQRRIWKSGTFVDFEHGLNAAMNRLRQALGDSAEQPTYIETLPGRGYRFVVAVQEAGAKPVLVMASTATAPVPDEPTHPVQPAILPANRKPWLLWIIAAATVTVLLLGFRVMRQPTVLSQPLRFSIFPPNGYALEAGSSRQTFALSPDGTRLAFTAMDATGVFQLFIRDLNALDPRLLPNSRGTYHVFWPPDGRSLFLTQGGSVRRTRLEDDSSQVICDTPAVMLTGALFGSTLLLSGREKNFIVAASGGAPRATPELYPWPQFLPDGRHLIYSVFDTHTGHRRARVVQYGDPQSVRDLVETDSRVMYAPSMLKPGTGYLVYVRAGNILAQPFDPGSLTIHGEPYAIVSQTYSFLPSGAADFSVSENGMLAYRRYQSRSQLAWVNRRGEVLRTIGPSGVNVKQARISPDGKKIAAPIFDVTRGINEMWIIDAQTGSARKALPGPGLLDNPVWSPDSTRIAFSRAYDTPPKLFVRGLGDTDTEQPLPPDYFQVPSDWSSDGRFLAYTNTGFPVDYEQKGDVWLIDMARGNKVIHLIRTPYHEGQPAFSPDGHWLAFTSDESGHNEMYVQAFDAGEPPRLVGDRHLISRNGASALRWSRDGKELIYLAWDGRLHAIAITLSPRVKASAPVPLFALSVEARAAMHSLIGFDVSADGQSFLVPIVASAEKSEIVVIQNWEAALRQNH